MNASDAWGYTNASNIVVAIVDTGLDLSHPDLLDNLWINHGEIPYDGIDNDGNGEAAQGVAWLLRGHGVCTAAAWQFVRRRGECGAHFFENVECVGKLLAHGQGGFCISKTSMAVGERFTVMSAARLRLTLLLTLLLTFSHTFLMRRLHRRLLRLRLCRALHRPLWHVQPGHAVWQPLYALGD